jgi:hypothetical protein
MDEVNVLPRGYPISGEWETRVAEVTPESDTYSYDYGTDDAFFPVASTPVLDDDGQPTGYQRIKRTDTDKTLAIPKMATTLTPYEVKVDILKTAIRDSELNLTGMTETVKTSHGGRKLFVGLDIPAEKQHIGHDDNVNLSINLWDSYDGSCALIVKAGCYRYKCSNMMLIGETISGVHKKHVGELVEDEIFAGVVTAIESWKIERDNFELWNDTPISEGDAYKSLLKFTDKQTIQDRLFAEFRKESGYGAATVWDFVNTLTAWATHTKARKGTEGNSLNARKDRQLAVLKFRNSDQFKSLTTV